jgi:TonB dependent receptor.
MDFLILKKKLMHIRPNTVILSVKLSRQAICVMWIQIKMVNWQLMTVNIVEVPILKLFTDSI